MEEGLHRHAEEQQLCLTVATAHHHTGGAPQGMDGPNCVEVVTARLQAEPWYAVERAVDLLAWYGTVRCTPHRVRSYCMAVDFKKRFGTCPYTCPYMPYH